MPYFIYVDYVYLNEIDELPKRYHEIFIHNICHDINIMTPSYIFRKYLIKLPRMYVEGMIFPWMQHNFHIVTKVSRIDERNRKS